jgi:hypothetical protein
MALVDGAAYERAMAALDAERALADELADLLSKALFSGHPKELIALTDRRDAVLAHYRKARQ